MFGYVDRVYRCLVRRGLLSVVVLMPLGCRGNFDISQYLADGETAVICGLTVTEVNRTRSGIPMLSRLPRIGALFSFTNNTESRQDLIILITPRIIDDGTGN